MLPLLRATLARGSHILQAQVHPNTVPRRIADQSDLDRHANICALRVRHTDARFSNTPACTKIVGMQANSQSKPSTARRATPTRPSHPCPEAGKGVYETFARRTGRAGLKSTSGTSLCLCRVVGLNPLIISLDGHHAAWTAAASSAAFAFASSLLVKPS
jgi:hypothetical protein